MSTSTDADTDGVADELSVDRAHLIHSLHNAPLQQAAHVWTSGRGAVLIDQNGREFLDAIAGLWNVVIGHGRSELGEVAMRQMSQLAYASSYAGSSNPAAIALAQRLAELCYEKINRFFFSSGGAEANEAAIKTARFYWRRRGYADKVKIIGRRWGYHGTTLAAMSATGMANYWPMFEPRAPGFLHIADPYPYRFESAPESTTESAADGSADSATGDDSRTIGEMAADLLEEAIQREGADTVAAFIGEPVQGASGVIVPPDDYWPRVREICDRHDVLIIADEVITAFGRTGDWFALGRWGIEPDIVSFAKAITSGYVPMGGIGLSDAIAEAIDTAGGEQTWMHAYTYSAHPVCCAVALANLDIIQREGLMQRAVDLGRRLRDRLNTLTSHPHVGEVRSIGLMAAVELVADKSTRAEFPAEEKIGARVHEATQRRGMFTRMRGDVYNFGPCFVTEEAQIDRMAEILGESIEEVLGG